MAQKVTIRDIAEKTGTSVTSVHRAIYGGKGISERLRQKILFEVEKSNYQMDEAASMLRRGQFHIAVLLPEAAREERFYYRGLWDGIYKGAEQLKKNKVKVTFVEATCGVSHMEEALEKLYDETDESLHGLVTVCDDEVSGRWLQRFIVRGTKIALIDRGVEIDNLCCCLEASSCDMAHLAVNMMHFLLGCEVEGTLVLVNGPESRISYKIYGNAVKEKLEELYPGLKVVTLNGYNIVESRAELLHLIESDRVCGIIASCARATYWICEMLSDLDLKRRPHIVGTDVFQELTPYFENGVLEAVICQNHREHGELALKILYEHLCNPCTSGEETTEPQVPLSLVLKENYKYYL